MERKIKDSYNGETIDRAWLRDHIGCIRILGGQTVKRSTYWATNADSTSELYMIHLRIIVTIIEKNWGNRLYEGRKYYMESVEKRPFLYNKVHEQVQQ